MTFVVIEFFGGRFDGKRVEQPELLPFYLVPEPPDIGSLFVVGPLGPLSLRVSVYRRTGLVRADGAHVYALDPKR